MESIQSLTYNTSSVTTVPALCGNVTTLGNNCIDYNKASSPATPSCGYHIVTIHTSLLVIVVTAGIVGNALSLMILHWRSPKSTFNFLIKALSYVDIVILLLLPVQRILFTYSTNHLAYLIFSKYIIDMAEGIARLASVWMLILLAFFRFMAVCVPMKVKLYCTSSLATRCIVGIFVMDIVVHLPFYFEQKIVSLQNSTGYQLVYTSWGVSKAFHIYAHVVYTSCLFFILPFISLIFFSVQMIKTLCGSQREKYFCLPHLKHEASDVTKVVIAIILVFLISYTPYLVWTVDTLIPGRMEKLRKPTCDILIYSFTMDIFLYVNSSANFFIYMLLRKQFRNSLVDLVRCRPKKRGRLQTRSITMETDLSV